MDVRRVFDEMPFADHLGIELTDVGDGTASGRLELAEVHSSTPATTVAHGGVTYALADSIGGAAVLAAVGSVAPTLDMRIDYLAPATGAGERLRADAEVVRLGSVATVDVDVTDGAGEPVAAARGVYKADGGEGSTAWGDARGR